VVQRVTRRRGGRPALKRQQDAIVTVLNDLREPLSREHLFERLRSPTQLF